METPVVHGNTFGAKVLEEEEGSGDEDDETEHSEGSKTATINSKGTHLPFPSGSPGSAYGQIPQFSTPYSCIMTNTNQTMGQVNHINQSANLSNFCNFTSLDWASLGVWFSA